MRTRFTGPADLIHQAKKYAKLDHRTFSELVCEALHQHMTRFKKKAEKRELEDVLRRLSEIEQFISLKYTQVPSGAKKGGSTEG